MGRIKGRGTGIEKAVERALRRRRIYFASHVTGLPGRPDIVFRNGRLAVFIDGDFWHGWRFPLWEFKLAPFWQRKIRGNRARDSRNFAALRRDGWKVLRLWEHEIEADVEGAVDRIWRALRERRARSPAPLHPPARPQA